MDGILFLRLNCAGCDVQLRISAKKAGHHVRCPACDVLTLSPTIERIEQHQNEHIPDPMMAEANAETVANTVNA